MGACGFASLHSVGYALCTLRLPVQPADVDARDLGHGQLRIFSLVAGAVGQQNTVADELDRGVAVPAVRVVFDVSGALPRLALVARDRDGERGTRASQFA